MWDLLMSGAMPLEEVCVDETIASIQLKLERQKQTLKCHPTAALWIQYMDMVDILRKFLKAERTGNWDLHLSTVHEMMPFMAAAGHNLYTKSLHLYLQDMLQLKETHKDVYQSFQAGHHVVLMRSLKTTGGLTRGRGMTEAQRTTWLLAMPACADVNRAMQDFTGTTYETSEQHRDMRAASQEKDQADITQMVCFLDTRDPFENTTDLKNIVTGVVAGPSTNTHQAVSVGTRIMDKMAGQTIKDFGFKRSDQAVTMIAASKNALKINDDVVSVDPQLLFQRLISAAGNMYNNRHGVFKYELASYPTSLFESPLLPRLPTKSDPADAIWKLAQDKMPAIPAHHDIQFVFDGGALLHLIPWARGSTFATIIQTYVKYVTDKFKDPIVVFDGYGSGPSTKDATHHRRSKGKASTDVHFDLTMIPQVKKEMFLANKKNKERFIHFLSDALTKHSCSTVSAEGDADAMIVAMALESSKTKLTVVVGDDTNLLVLLCHYGCNKHDIFFQPSYHIRGKTPRIWSIRHTVSALDTPVVISPLVPVLHSMSGCDTTSRPFGIGKRTALGKLKNCEEFRTLANKFAQPPETITPEEVIQAGEKMLILLYDGTAESLDDLRYKTFSTKVATASTYLQVHSLPPTSAAAKYHSLRVYHQAQEWFGSTLDPLAWGWKMVGSLLAPITTDLPAAPAKLLSIIRCNCKSGCDTKQCSCRKHGLDCSPACGECSGFQCSNAAQPSEDD
ncbi:uncharacterized protein [Littorina saxatilis]|uniref:uncharacterized protein n=1 Tax=Littorina saxatilis TaxID=31220 RepID=UPI0038B58DD1